MSDQPTYHYDRRHKMICLGSRVRVGESYYTVVWRDNKYWLSGEVDLPLSKYPASELLVCKKPTSNES